MRRKFDPQFRTLSSLGSDFVQLPSFWNISIVRCTVYLGESVMGGFTVVTYVMVLTKDCSQTTAIGTTVTVGSSMSEEHTNNVPVIITWGGGGSIV